MRSLGASEITESSVTLGGTLLGTFPVVDDAATITVTIPSDAAEGATALHLVSAQSGTEVVLPLTVTAGPEPTPTPTPTPTETVNPTPTPTPTSPGGKLPSTGAEGVGGGLIAAAFLVGAGALLVAFTARRRVTSTD